MRDMKPAKSVSSLRAANRDEWNWGVVKIDSWSSEIISAGTHPCILFPHQCSLLLVDTRREALITLGLPIHRWVMR